jgi:type I restriction enzyme S subunit
MTERTLASVAVKGGLVGGPFGSNLVGSDYREFGVPVIRGTNMGGAWVGGEFAFVSPEKFAEDLSRNSAAPGDIVFTQRGTLGQVARVPAEPYQTYVVSQSQMRLRVDESLADPAFVYYACTHPRFLQQVKERAISTGVPHINLGILSQLRIPDLPRGEQAAIAHALGALDDKIAANRSVVSACDQLARAYWASTAAEGRPLSSLARFVNGRAFTKGASGTGRVVVRIAELNSGIGASTVRNDIEVADDHVARPGDLLFAWSGSLVVARRYRPEAIINQHIFKVIPRDGLPKWLVNQAIRAKLEDFRAIAADKATTMGHIQRAHLDQVVVLPTQTEIDRLDGVMQALWDRSLAAEVETLELETARDGLLPLLSSGRVKVRHQSGALTGDVTG